MTNRNCCFTYIKILFIFCLSITYSQATVFKNYEEAKKCFDDYESFDQYKIKLKSCFDNKNITFEDESINLIKNKSGIIQQIIKLDLPLEKKNIFKESPFFNLKRFLNPNYKKEKKLEESLFDKPTVFSEDYLNKKFSLDEKDFSNLNRHIKAKPKDIYALTEDINYLTYKKNYISEFKRNEILLNIYNSFDPNSLNKIISERKAKKEEFSTPSIGGLAAITALAAAGGSGGGGGSSTPPTLSYTVSSKNISECSTGLTITANLTKAHSSNVVITYSTSGTATNGVDYNLTSSTTTIVSGGTTAQITLAPVNDTTNETSETIIISASATGGLETTGNTETTITIHDYVLACNSTAYTEDTSQQNTITNRTAWTNVDGDVTGGHPFELLNIHKAHSFKDGSGQYLTGEGETVHVADFGCDENHEQFNNKTVTMIDNDATFNPSHTELNHCIHVAGIAVGDINASRQGVAPDADVAFSHVGTSGTNMAGDLDSARALSAVSSNNSWGFCAQKIGGVCVDTFEATTLQNLMTANSTTHAEQLAASTSLFTSSTDVDTYIAALDNFQNNGIIVFSAGNVVEDDADAMAALPFFYDGVKETTDLSDAWITIIYADYTGSSLNSASTSDFTRKGNACGNSKEYCLTVDDFKISSGSHVTAGGSSEYDNIQGSSMGSPMISGGIALLAQAFPNHTPEQLADRLLASANNDWFTPTGNTTFTTHGASVKHGYHNEWGHGVPDFYAALSPITTSRNPLSFGGGGGSGGGGSGSADPIPFANMMKYPIKSSRITTSNSIGDAIYSSLKDKKVYAYDALNGGFIFNVSDFISDGNNPQIIDLTINDELNNLRNYKKIENDFDSQNFEGEFINLKDKFDRGVSITLDQNNIADQNYNRFKNKFYKNPFTTVNKGLGFNSKFYLMGNDIVIGYNNSNLNPLTNVNKDIILPVENLSMSIDLKNDQNNLYSLISGFMKEKNSFLLSKSEGAFGLGDNGSISNYYGINLLKNTNSFGSFFLNSMMSHTMINNDTNKMVIDSSGIISSNFEIGFKFNNLFNNDQLKLSLSQPNRVEKGNMKFRLMGLANKNGEVPYDDHTISLSPSGRQKDMILSYYKNFDDALKIGFKSIFTDDHSHVKSSSIDANFFITATLNF